MFKNTLSNTQGSGRYLAAAPELGNAQVDDTDARHEAALRIAVSFVAISACVFSLSIDDLVNERLNHDANELLDIDHPVIESRYLVYLWCTAL